MRDNSASFAALQAAIAQIRALGQLAERAAPLVAEALKQDATRRIAQGVDPNGRPWPLTKSGQPALRNATKALTASASGTVAILRISGPEALHHAGRAKGHVQRRILPGRNSLESVAATVRRVAAEEFKR